MSEFKPYLFVVEIGKVGFIGSMFDSLEEAKELSDELIDLIMGPFKQNRADICRFLMDKGYFTYFIKGNQRYVGNVANCISNGVFTVSVVNVRPEHFCLKSFVKERENSSWLFEDLDDDRLDDYSQYRALPN